MFQCPKCRKSELVEGKHSRLYCPYVNEELDKDHPSRACGFACGLSFFYDDESTDLRKQIGLSNDKLQISPRAQELMDSGILALDDFEQSLLIEKLEAVASAQKREDETEEYMAMMREVLGHSASIHRYLTSGDSYRKNLGGGLKGKKLG